MATFSWGTCEIRMDNLLGGTNFTLSEVTAIPVDEPATITLTHEYVHFLQLLSSLGGYRLLAYLIEHAVHGALTLSGVAARGDTVSGYQDILPLLRQRPDGEGMTHPDLEPKIQRLRQEVSFNFGLPEYPYLGTRGAWEIDQQCVPVNIYDDATWGIITPRRTFRPITVAMLAEGMARRIDRWLAANMGSAYAPAGNSVIEAEFYNGIRNVLSQPRYEHQVHPTVLDRLTVVMCHLALATGRPDESMAAMLVRLQDPRTAGGTAQAIAMEMSRLLRASGVLTASKYNEQTHRLEQGDASVMRRTEYGQILRQLQRIQVAANQVFSNPMYFANPDVDWQTVKGWMTRFSLPPVIVGTDELSGIDGIVCTTDVTLLLREVQRVLM